MMILVLQENLKPVKKPGGKNNILNLTYASLSAGIHGNHRSCSRCLEKFIGGK